MKIKLIKPNFLKKRYPRIGLIALATDLRIEKDFINVVSGKNIDLYVNRIPSYNPLTNQNLVKMAKKITQVTKEILPGQKLDCVAYGCTSGTVATGYNKIKKKINLAKPKTKVTTPITSTIKALKKFKIKRISIFTPYTQKINESMINYFKKEKYKIDSFNYFNISSDINIGKVSEEYLFKVLSKIDLKNSDALFISCTALPAMTLINKLEKKFNKLVLSSNQTLIWDSLNAINYKEKIDGFGKLFNS